MNNNSASAVSPTGAFVPRAGVGCVVRKSCIQLGLRSVPALLVLLASVAFGQTTQAMLAGRVLDVRNGRPLHQSRVVVHPSSSAIAVAVQTDESGHYAASQLSPGLYRVRVTAD